jgi:hypothetical protein
MKRDYLLLGFVGPAVATACAEDVASSPVAKKLVQPDYSAGFCCGTECQDRYPDSIGIYIAPTITVNACFGNEMTDADNDGLADVCETELAGAFNPELRYSSGDEVWGGEPVCGIRFRVA